MTDKKQTSVDYLLHATYRMVELISEELRKLNEAIEKTKEMEKEQIITAFNQGLDPEEKSTMDTMKKQNDTTKKPSDTKTMSDNLKILGQNLAILAAAIILWMFVPVDIEVHEWFAISWAVSIIIRVSVPKSIKISSSARVTIEEDQQ